jgi:uridine kinase
MQAVRDLCRSGTTEVPIYEIALNGRTGSRCVDLGGHTRFVAEGIFAPEIVADSRDDGLLAAAYCVTQHPLVTFWRRLTRDLREHRKPPLLLVRRGLDLMRDQRRVVDHAVERGCQQATPDQAYAELTASP